MSRRPPPELLDRVQLSARHAPLPSSVDFAVLFLGADPVTFDEVIEAALRCG